MAESSNGRRNWAVSVLITISLALASFALTSVIALREDLVTLRGELARHAQTKAHSEIDERVRALELAKATGKRLVARDGVDLARLIERLARAACDADAKRRLPAMREIENDAQGLSEEIRSRDY